MDEIKFGEDVIESSIKPPLENESLRKILSTSSYDLYRDSRTGNITIYVSDYHAGTLTITKKGLEKLAQG